MGVLAGAQGPGSSNPAGCSLVSLRVESPPTGSCRQIRSLSGLGLAPLLCENLRISDTIMATVEQEVWIWAMMIGRRKAAPVRGQQIAGERGRTNRPRLNH